MSNTQEQTYPIKQILKIFGSTATQYQVKKAVEDDDLPQPSRSGKNHRRTWGIESLPFFGEKYGFLTKPNETVIATVYALKGGVLKTTLTYNLARVAALHNIRTCVIGLDMQCDITRTMDVRLSENLYENLEDLEEMYASIQGLTTLIDPQIPINSIESLILESDIPNLHYIPETPDLAHLEKMLHSKTRREHWIEDNLIDKIKDKYDLILFDCPPHWNLLTGAALVASNVLISPVECQPGGWGNNRMFLNLIEEFKKEAKTDFYHISVPTKYAVGERLSPSIMKYYIQNLPACTLEPIRISVASKEAMVKRKSLLEYKPTDKTSAELRQVINELWGSILENLKSTQKTRLKVKPSRKRRVSARA